jgi:hypothetical protein
VLLRQIQIKENAIEGKKGEKMATIYCHQLLKHQIIFVQFLSFLLIFQ